MIHVTGGAESNSSPGGKSAKRSRVVMFDAVTASNLARRVESDPTQPDWLASSESI